MSRQWFWSAAAVLALAGPAAAQAPSPLELAAGIREAGLPDLALEYLKEIEPKLSPAEKAAVPLERAKCLLDAADEEPDEGTRTSMVNEAKEGFNTFLATNATHPRASEAALALARLVSIEAKAQLNRARRLEIPPVPEEGPDKAEKERERDDAIAKRAAEASKAGPMFLAASKRFADAAAEIKKKLAEPNLDPAVRASLSREAFEAELAAAINQYNLSETVLASGAKTGLQRDELLEKAREKFAELAKGPPHSRTVWIGRAWMAEVLGDQGKPNEMKDEFDAILKAQRQEAEEGKKLVRFFQIRRTYLDAIGTNDPGKLSSVETALRGWLERYGNTQRPSPEVIAARYYRAYTLQRQGWNTISKMTPDKNGRINLPESTQTQFKAAERLYRQLSQTDHDYTARANQNRMFVVRRLLGEADKPAIDYGTFEDAQMAALIQMAKLGDAEKLLERMEETAPDADNLPFWNGLRAKGRVARVEAEVKDRKFRVVALLERARELATDKDNAGDVTDNLLRLVYYYQTTDQPYQAAVLGEHVARTIKSTGGKGSLAGLLALNGYVIASTRIKAEAADPTMAEAAALAAAAARKADRERAIVVARFLDEKFPNDTSTDTARHRLASLLSEDGKTDAAFEAIIKIRPGYSLLLNARQMEGYLAALLINSKPEAGVTAERKMAVFRRAIGDLSRIPKPGPNSPEAEVRGWVGVRLRLAQLYLAQNRADPETEAKAPGYGEALKIAEEVIAAVPSFTISTDKDKKLTLDGMEMEFQAKDVRARAVYLRGKSLVDAKKLDEAAAAIEPAVAEAGAGSLLDEKMKAWLGGTGDAGDPEDVASQKTRIANLANSIDKVRRDVVMVGFKLRCVQGKPTEAAAMLDALKKAGGGIESNKEALESMARELAAQIPQLRKESKAKEADDLGAGLALLLQEFTAVKDLPTTTILFLGQTFFTVGRFDEAIGEFNKIKVPTFAEWQDRAKVEGLPADQRGRIDKEVREYRFAQMYIGKCLRGARKFPEAEKQLVGAIGTPDKQGWAYSSLDFRKELAGLYEDWGASIPDVKGANVQWGKSLKEWTTLFQFSQNGLKQIKPETPADQAKAIRSGFYGGYYEVQRCLVSANTQLQKGSPKLATTFEQVGKRIADMENTAGKFNELKEIDGPDGTKIKIKAGTEMITNEVWNHYCDLLAKYPELMASYKANGGKFFLERPKD